MNTWNDEDVERWLNDNPLPAEFEWNGERVWPRYQLKHGYGQWLRTAGSYHVALRGLFRLVCDVLQEIPDGAEMPSTGELIVRLQVKAQPQAALDLPAAAPAAAPSTPAP